MTIMRAARSILLFTVALFCSAQSCDEEWSCTSACRKLVKCEESWMAQEDMGPMTEAEKERYFDECDDDCYDVGSADEMECVETATCDELLEGRCSG